MPAGRPLEPAGDGRPRWMAAHRGAARRRGDRIRLTCRLVRPASTPQKRRSAAVGPVRQVHTGRYGAGMDHAGAAKAAYRLNRVLDPLHSAQYFAPETEQYLTAAGLRPGRM